MKTVAIVGAGPAGLMAADVLSSAGVTVRLFDAMPSIGRKFLLAGKGGLNLTHAEPADLFASRYGQRRQQIEALFEAFNASSVRAWAASLGIETFVGSSGRVFPTDMKAAPLLRAWLARLRHPKNGPAVQFFMRHRWTGWHTCAPQATADADGACAALTWLTFDTPHGPENFCADAVVLALGGGSWGRLGSTGAWVPWLQAKGVAVAPLLPSNCGFDVQNGWSEHFATRFAGQPFKSVAIVFSNQAGTRFARKGEFVATATGVEGSLVYSASAMMRDTIAAEGSATFHLDLLPDMTHERVLAEIQHPRGSRSLSSHLKSRLHVDGIKAALLYEKLSKEQMNDPLQLAQALKALPITLNAARPIDEAISSAGGVLFEGLTNQLMVETLPGVFCAGEMLDWEAPTGGYLLTACLASGAVVGQGVQAYFDAKTAPSTL
jgi:uncharacterized flavoprotein (TIGR03862 family)